MAEPVRSVTIVGGGTAGWLSALMLNSFMSHRAKPQERVQVTLIESPDIPTVGVGEATVPNIPRTLIDCGISEAQFFRACNSSFKLGVLFDKWNVDGDGNPICYLNPFARPPVVNRMEMALYMLKFGAGDLEFAELCGPHVDLIEAKRGPRALGEKEFGRNTQFAYHLDAGKFAALLRDICVERGVMHILDNLREVEQDENGTITALQLEQRGRHPVELVLDCTGFRGLIVNQALGGEFISYAKHLANDRAMAVQIPHSSDTIEPATCSTALGAGWSWRVPLASRIGTGYVYSSAYRSDDEAREEFLAHLGPGAEEFEPRVIPMRVGRNREAWVKNCVAVGLSGGFIEPLESTAIHMIDMSVRHLMTLFPDKTYPEPLRRRYNLRMERLYDEVRDFICAHYALSNRTDTQYWIDARDALEVPDRLAENLELWRYALPNHNDLSHPTLFSHETYQAVLLGKRVYETGYAARDFAAATPLNEDKWWDFVMKRRAHFADVAERAPDHRRLLHNIRGEEASGERKAPDPATAENSLL